MQAEIDYLKATLKNTEELLEASEAMVETAEANYALLEDENRELRNLLDLERRLRQLEKIEYSGTQNSGPVSSQKLVLGGLETPKAVSFVFFSHL